MSVIKDGLRMAALAVDGYEMIEGLMNVSDDKAPVALKAVSTIVKMIRDGVDGKTSPDIVENGLAVLKRSLADDDAAFDAALREKFDTSLTE